MSSCFPPSFLCSDPVDVRQTEHQRHRINGRFGKSITLIEPFDLGESAQRAIELEAAADQMVRTIKRLQPRKNQ